jgi:integrase
VQNQGNKPRRVKVAGYKGVYQRPDGRYEYCYQDNNGTTRWATAQSTTVRGAEGERADKIAKRARGENVVPFERKKFRDAAEGYMSLRRRNRTWLTYEAVFRNHVYPRFGNTPLADISGEDITRMLLDLERAGLGGVSQRKILGAMNQVFRYALGKRPRWIESNPVDEVQHKPEPSDREQRILSIEECNRLVEVASPDWMKLLLRVLVLSGLRISEALALRWVDVDFDRGYILVRAQMARSLASSPGGERVKRERSENLKTKNSRRDVKLSTPLREILLAHRDAVTRPPDLLTYKQLSALSGISLPALAQRKERHRPGFEPVGTVHGEGRYSLRFSLAAMVENGIVKPELLAKGLLAPEASDYIFAPEPGAMPPSYALCYSRWGVAVKAAGLTKDKTGRREPTPHDTRHTYVSMLIAEGLPATLVASQIGDTVATTLNTYVSLFRQIDDEKRITEALEKHGRELVAPTSADVLELPPGDAKEEAA